MNDQTQFQVSQQDTQKTETRSRHWGPPFWTTISVISLIINAILIAVLLVLGSQIFKIKALVQDQLLGGLSENFAAMDEAHIRTTIPVENQTVLADFDLTIQQETIVELSKDVYIQNADIYDLYTPNGGLQIDSAIADIRLPAGTSLPINLVLVVPVEQEIPVNLNVAVDIPLNQSDLHQPFTGLQEVVNPYIELLEPLPDSWAEVFCGKEPGKFCSWLFK